MDRQGRFSPTHRSQRQPIPADVDWQSDLLSQRSRGSRQPLLVHTVRYRLARWLHDGQRFVVVSDAGGEETLEIHRGDAARRMKGLSLGRVVDLRASPKTDAVALSNHRNEFVHVDLRTGKSRVLDK